MKKTPQIKDLEKEMRALFLAFIEEKKANRTPFSKSVVEEGSPDFRFHQIALGFIASAKEKVQVEIPMAILASVCRAVWNDSKKGFKPDDAVGAWKLDKLLDLTEFFNTNKLS